MIDLSVIIKPVVTEKTSAQMGLNKYAFQVKKDAHKEDIAKAFEAIYGVKPVSITTQIIVSKTRLIAHGRTLTKRPVNKRAIITLAKGKSIDPNKVK